MAEVDPRWAVACERARELLHDHLCGHPDEDVRALNEVLMPSNDDPSVVAIAQALIQGDLV